MTEQKDQWPTEPKYALEHLRQGAFGFGEFRGQHALYIPLKVFEALGQEKILQIANDVYGKDALRKFGISHILCQNSFLIELPPKIDLLRKFIAALRNAM